MSLLQRIQKLEAQYETMNLGVHFRNMIGGAFENEMKEYLNSYPNSEMPTLQNSKYNIDINTESKILNLYIYDLSWDNITTFVDIFKEFCTEKQYRLVLNVSGDKLTSPHNQEIYNGQGYQQLLSYDVPTSQPP